MANKADYKKARCPPQSQKYLRYTEDHVIAISNIDRKFGEV